MWCARCQKDVHVWTDAYVESGKVVETTLCKRCNAILSIKKIPIEERRKEKE